MSVNFDVDLSVDLDDVLRAQLAELEFSFSTEFLTWFLGVEITQFLQARAERRFAREGDDASGKWKPLSEFTREERRALGFGGAHPINVRTGEMEDWVMQNNSSVVGSDAAGVFDLEWPARMPSPGSELETKVKTAQQGKRRGEKSVPKRPILAVGEIDLVHLLAQYALNLKPAGVTFE